MPRTDEAPDAMLMIEPLPFFSMPGRHALMVRSIERTLRSNAKSHSSSVAVQHRAVVHVAGRVHQHVDRPDLLAHLLDQRVHVGGRAHIELGERRLLQAFELLHVEVGRDHLRAFGDEAFRDRAPDPLPRRRHQRDLAFQSSGQTRLPYVAALSAARLCFCRPSLSKLSGASQRSNAALRAGHSLSRIEYQAVSRFSPFTI